MSFKNITEIKEANKAIGNFWFSPDTMDFFASKVVSKVYKGHYFITSEQDSPRQPRPLFTIRYASDDGAISTVGEFQGWATLDDAIAAVQEIE